uniref:Uncharacterized protein n=1 Tax=Sphaerodactylus townsendi TaxID=933632 RepID=A0ACB8FTP0_9SAUR
MSAVYPSRNGAASGRQEKLPTPGLFCKRSQAAYSFHAISFFSQDLFFASMNSSGLPRGAKEMKSEGQIAADVLVGLSLRSVGAINNPDSPPAKIIPRQELYLRDPGQGRYLGCLKKLPWQSKVG